MQKRLLTISSVVSKMIRVSVNILTSSIILLQRIDTYHFASLSELIYSKIASVNTEDIFNFILECGWVRADDHQPGLTPRGADILELNRRNLLIDAQREMLADYILKVTPIWANRIPYGRREAAIFMTKDEKACFAEARLLSEYPDLNIVSWWDRIADHIRSQSHQIRNDIGRAGERNTIKYERIRTSSEPEWMSVDSNLLGYDIKSQKDRKNPEMLLIEVKTSSSVLSEAFFHVTAHEWHVAEKSTAYVFHLWCLGDGKKQLAVLTPLEISPYIPTNNLEGVWENVKIPFLCFKEKFAEVIL